MQIVKIIVKIILCIMACLLYYIKYEDRKRFKKENTIHSELKAIDCSIWALICILVIIAL